VLQLLHFVERYIFRVLLIFLTGFQSRFQMHLLRRKEKYCKRSQKYIKKFLADLYLNSRGRRRKHDRSFVVKMRSWNDQIRSKILPSLGRKCGSIRMIFDTLKFNKCFSFGYLVINFTNTTENAIYKAQKTLSLFKVYLLTKFKINFE
jgi:hypothetical protein